MTEEIIVKKSVLINASASRVWDAITNPSVTKKYMYNSEVISDWTEGSPIIWRDADNKNVHVKGKIIKIEAERYLETKDLSIDSGLPDLEPNYTRVIYKLREENRKTILEVIENNFNGDERRVKDAENFWTTVLKQLKVLLEK